jgi:hypothetical protein
VLNSKIEGMMDQLQTTTPTYSTLHFLVRHGHWFAAIVGLAPVLLGGWAVSAGMPYIYGVFGLLGSAFLYLVMRSYVELVRVIVDMLLPK